MTVVSLKDESDNIKKERKRIQEKLRRMAKAFIDGLIHDDEYDRQRRSLELQLESLVIPEVNAAEEAGQLIQNLPKLWNKANPEEQRRLLLTMLDAVYVDAKGTKSVVAIKPKPPFRPIFQVASQREGSVIQILERNTDNTSSQSLFLVEAGGGGGFTHPTASFAMGMW